MLTSVQNNNINFKSTPIHKIKLFKVSNEKVCGTVDAVISKLNSSDYYDIEKIKNNWDSDLIDSFTYNFGVNCKVKNNNFYAIELINQEPLSKKIVGLMYDETKVNDDEYLKLNYILTHPQFNKKVKNRELKGIGEILFYKAFSDAKITKANKLDFVSINNGFYNNTFNNAKIGFTDKNKYYPLKHKYSIDKSSFDKYLNYCKEKYGFDLVKDKFERSALGNFFNGLVNIF